jgi:hypothetical protein
MDERTYIYYWLIHFQGRYSILVIQDRVPFLFILCLAPRQMLFMFIFSFMYILYFAFFSKEGSNTFYSHSHAQKLVPCSRAYFIGWFTDYLLEWATARLCCWLFSYHLFVLF